MAEINILTTLKKMLGETSTKNDELIGLAVDFALTSIRDYCNYLPNEAIPKSLLPIVYDLSIGKYREYKNNLDGTLLEVKSASDNGQSVSYGKKESGNSDAIKFLNKYEKMLNKYRRIIK